MYDKIIKRIIDFILSLILIIIFLIPMCIFSILIKLQDKGPAIFVQRRVARQKDENKKYINAGDIKDGKNLQLFNLYKFRSMKMSTPHNTPTHLLKNPEQYMLPIGEFIRKYSIDELPQLFNILKGDMSFVGPRPALFNQDDLVMEREKYNANVVRPGLTGLAQISGRDELEIEIKAKYDGEYVKNESFLFDVKCFFGTFKKVLTHDGVKEGGPTTKC